VELINITYQGKQRSVQIVQAEPERTIYLIYLLDDELKQEFGSCILSNRTGGFYACNERGQREETELLYYELFRALYKLNLVD